MNNEIRTREIQFTTDNNTISGMPIVFNSLSEVLWDAENKRSFREVIAPEALSQAFIDTQDIMLNLDHDRNKVLARRKCGRGSMNVRYDNDGVRFNTEVPDTQLGHDVYRMIERGDYTAMSFCYTDGRNVDDVTWDFKTDDGIPTRTVHRIERLYDIAIVYNPAFSQTSVTARSIEDLEEKYKADLVEIKPIEELKEEAGVLTEETKEQEIESTPETTVEERECEDDNSYLDALKPYRDILENMNK